MITVQRFIISYLLYLIFSLVVAASISFTGAAWVIYFFSLLPLYLICALYCLNLYINHRHQKIDLVHEGGLCNISNDFNRCDVLTSACTAISI